MKEEEIEVSENLKKLLLSEVDLIRDSIDILLLFTEAGVKTGVKILEELESKDYKINE